MGEAHRRGAGGAEHAGGAGETRHTSAGGWPPEPASLGQGPQVRLSSGTGRLVAGLLELLSELPSTAEVVADGARRQVGQLVERLPRPRRGAERDHDRIPPGSLSLDLETATEVVELLELFAAMPSTPPAVAADAQYQAEGIARHLRNPQPPAPTAETDR